MIKRLVSISEAMEWALTQGVQLPGTYARFSTALATEAARLTRTLLAMYQTQAVIDRLYRVLDQGGTFGEWQKQLESDPGLLELPDEFTAIMLCAYLQSWYLGGRCMGLHARAQSRPLRVRYLALNQCRNNAQHARFHGRTLWLDANWLKHNFPPNHLPCHCILVADTGFTTDSQSDAAQAGDACSPGWDFSVCEQGRMHAVKRDLKSMLSACDPEQQPGPLPALRQGTGLVSPLQPPEVVQEWTPAQQALDALIRNTLERIESPLATSDLYHLCQGAENPNQLQAQFATLMTPFFSNGREAPSNSKFERELKTALFSADIFGFVMDANDEL